MQLYSSILLFLLFPLNAVAQDTDRLEALTVGTQWALASLAERGHDVSDLVVDLRRTAEGETDQRVLVARLAERLNARPGVVENFCVELPPTARGFLQAEVRGVSAVLAPRVREWTGETARVGVTVFRGSGRNTGIHLDVPLIRTTSGWSFDDDAQVFAESGIRCRPGG